MPFHTRTQDRNFLAKEFGREQVTLELEGPSSEQRFYPTRNAEDEREFRFLGSGKDLFYGGDVLIKSGKVYFFNLFPGQESQAPEDYRNDAFRRRAQVISREIEKELVFDFD